MKTKDKDFIELDFTGLLEDNQVFDTTSEKVAKDKNIYAEENKDKFKPIKINIGNNSLPKGFNQDLIDKETEKEFEITLEPKDGFGPRNPKLVRTVSSSQFKEQPYRGMLIDVNGMIAKVISVSGGRATIDMNNPLAGKTIKYQYTIKKIITVPKEKLEILADTFILPIEKIEKKEDKYQIKLKTEFPEKYLDKFKEKVKELIKIDIEITK
ncbi:MAG: peptidylprolyl isomerase [archaeon]